MDNEFLEELGHILNPGQIRQNERMEQHTSLHIGGEADYFVTPSSIDEIKAVMLLCRQKGLPYYIIGNGSNLLVADSGYRGMIIKLGENYSNISINEDGIVTAQSGVLLSKLANEVAKNSLTGFEFAAGIPGSLGGAVTMNAGAYGGEMKQCLISAKLMDEAGEVRDYSSEELKLGYRSSILQKGNLCCLEASMRFASGDRQQIADRIKELNAQRREKQPLDKYSAGSTFKRPEGYFAGKLITDSGLKGYQVGGAFVSEKHAGFVVNNGNATAEDFVTVVRDVIRTVYEKFGVRLEPEVKFLGDLFIL